MQMQTAAEVSRFSWPVLSLNFSSWKTGPKDRAPYWKVFEKHVELTYASCKQSFYPIFIMSKKQTPSDFLKQIIGRPVVVKLNNGVDYRGKDRVSLSYVSERLLSVCTSARFCTDL